MVVDAVQVAETIVGAVAAAPAGRRVEDDPEVQLALSDAISVGPVTVLLALAERAAHAREAPGSSGFAWGIYVDELRRVGTAHRGLSSRCGEVLDRLDARDAAAAERAAQRAYDVHGKRALWWFAHVVADLGVRR
jgi:hypothetical protein